MGFKFERLDVWRRSIEFADLMFSIAQTLPQEYQFSLGEQLRGASLSIPTNIAERCGRESAKEQKYFYRVAKGSVYEVVSLLTMIGKRGEFDRTTYRKNYDEANEIAAILSGLSR